MTAITDGANAVLRIDELRKERGISVKALAEAVGVDPSTIWRYQQGMMPTLDIAKRIANALGVTVDDLAMGNPTPAPPPGPSSPPPPPGPKVGN